MSAEKKIVIIAGPNGAGKTTFAREWLPREAGCPRLALVRQQRTAPSIVVTRSDR
jgi:ABC-type Mn2+/Zn2+ transport system ATPase subunit